MEIPGSIRPAPEEGAAWSRARPPIVLTGATGFLGRHFLYHLGSFGRWSAVALMRGRSAAERNRRLCRALEAAAESYGERRASSGLDLATVGADIEQPYCRLEEQEISALRARKIDQFWHFAASLDFKERRRSDIIHANVDGARNALVLAAQIGAERFVYVSTAYAAGRTTGVIREEAHDCHRAFSNPYEESKCRAEHEVLSFGASLGVAVTVLRPTIVLGPYSSKRTGGSRTGLYGLVRELGRLRVTASLPPPLRVSGLPKAEVNMIPVDWLMDDIRAISARGFAGGDVFHLCTASSPSVEDTIEAMCTALGLPRIEVFEAPISDSRVEPFFSNRLAFYRAYATVDRTFARSLPGARALTKEDLSIFRSEAVRELLPMTGGDCLRQGAAGAAT